MSLKQAFGLGEGKKIRYGVVGLGWIAQSSFLPGIGKTSNSEVTAIVTGDGVKSREIKDKYDIADSYTYEQFDDLLKSGKVDALYIALPNWQHEEYTERALRAGIHVLLEKPSEIDAEHAKKIWETQRESRAKLMVAYRLHFEPGTLDTLRRVRAGEFGKVFHFSSVFTQHVSPENERANNGWAAGPVLDMGPYPINTARNMFGAEPTEVFAFGTRHPEADLGNFDDTVTVLLKFPERRTAQLVCSYAGEPINQYTMTGTKGWIELNPGYLLNTAMHARWSIDGDKSDKKYPKTQHFGGETEYFSNCILNGSDPEPDAEEAWCDLRVFDAVKRALETGEVQKLEPYTRSKQIDPDAQVEKLSPAHTEDLVHAHEPSKGR